MRKLLLATAAVFALATGAFADDAVHASPHVALGDVEWLDAPIPGVQLALAWGEDATGAAWLFKIDPGVELPMHIHTHDYWGLTIQGNWVHVHQDGSETATGPGDYALVRGGDVHADKCDDVTPCVGLLAFSGPRDVALAQ